jgi:hypothetical protein
MISNKEKTDYLMLIFVRARVSRVLPFYKHKKGNLSLRRN